MKWLRTYPVSGFAPALGGVLVFSACDLATGPDRGVAYVDVVAGGSNSCARTLDGHWHCWGWGDVFSSRGLDRSRPTPIGEDPGLVSLSAGQDFTCGLDTTGAAYCWGENIWGQLGLGEAGGTYYTPVRVHTDVRFSRLAGTGSTHTMCGLDEGGEAHCWGNNFRRQLGAGVDVVFHPEVVPVLGGRSFALLAADAGSVCALTAARDYYCWGGLTWWGHAPDLLEPVLLAPATRFDTLVAGYGARCGLLEGAAHCHSLIARGALGNGTTDASLEFVPVSGGHRFEQLSGGGSHFCGVTFDGDAYCWGVGSRGQLGNGLKIKALVPVVVSGGHEFEKVAAGGSHTCGLTTGGEVYCWGSGVWGQLGNGSTQDQLRPVRVTEPVEP